MSDQETVVVISADVTKSEHEQAWSHLFQSIAVIEKYAKQPGFNKCCFDDAADGRVWSIPALMRVVDKRLTIIRIEGNRPIEYRRTNPH